MFIAAMYSYGKDSLSVGVDGILGCMGVFVKYGDMLYAIHQPPNSVNINKVGRDAFCKYIADEAPGFNGANARVFFLLNNHHRPDVMDEIKEYQKKLGFSNAEIIRVRDNLNNKSASAAILCERIGGGTCVIKYQQAGQVNWQDGGTQRAGHYQNSGYDYSYTTNGAVSKGWDLATSANSMIQVTRFS